MRHSVLFALISATLVVPASAELVLPPKPAQTRAHPPAARGQSAMSVGEPDAAPLGDLFLGQGYNALTGKYLPGQCVAGNGSNKVYGATELEGTMSHIYINAVSDMQTNASASGTDAGFDFTYKLIRIGFSSGSSSQSFFNSVDSYGKLFYRVATRGEAFRGDTWSSLGKIEISNPLKRFTQICGTHYVHAIYYGHQIDHTYRFTLNRTALDSKSQNDLSLGVGKIFGFNYSDTASAQKVDELSTMSVDNQSRGLLPTLPATPTTAHAVPDLTRYARNSYRTAVLKAPANAALPVLVELVPYSNLPATGSGNISEWPEQLRGAIAGRAGTYQSFLTVLGDLDRATKLPTAAAAALYEDPTSAATKLTDALKAQTEFRKAVRECVKLLDANTKPTDADVICTDKLDAVLNPSIVDSFRLKLKS